MCVRIFISLVLFFAMSKPLLVFSQESNWDNEDDWGDNWAKETISPWQFSGFTELALGQFLQSNIVDKKQSLSEIRLKLNTEYGHEQFDIKAVADIYYDQIIEKVSWQPRELSITFSPIPNLDVKLGRQVMTWGTGDYLFLNDLFSKDWPSFFSGREDEFLKAPANAARLTYYLDNYVFDFAYMPNFTPDNYITGERFSFYSPEIQRQIAPAGNFSVKKTSKATYAIRLATTINSVEIAVYGYQGYWPSPYGSNDVGQAYFPVLYSYGFSLRTPLASGLFNVEFAQYNSIEDAKGTLVNIANDQLKFLLGYEQELIKHLTFGVQYYVEKTEDYNAFSQTSDFSEQLVDEYHQMATARLTYNAMQEKLISTFFIFWSPTAEDGYLKPSINYRYNDNWSVSVGGNIFFGNKNYTFWGQHQKNSNIWLRARVNF